MTYESNKVDKKKKLKKKKLLGKQESSWSLKTDPIFRVWAECSFRVPSQFEFSGLTGSL